MGVEDFAKELGLNQEGQIKDGYYVIQLEDSDEYSYVYNILDKSDILELDISTIKLDEVNNQVTYVGNNYDVVLNADFDNDIYTVTIK